jgi:hypothetical protein
VNLGRLQVGVAYPLLQLSRGDALGGHPGSEGVAKVVEANRSHAGGGEGLLESPDQIGMVEHGALLRVGENEVVVCLIRGALEMAA